jgi:amidase
LAPSFDTGGWFARDAAVLRRAGAALLDPSSRQPAHLRRLLVATDAFALAEESTSRALYGAMSAKIDQARAGEQVAGGQLALTTWCLIQ